MTDATTKAPRYIAGVDEAGRGPLAGPVVAAAVILSASDPIAGIDDSKKLTAKARETLSLEIKERALCWSIASAEPEEIDELNILHATMAAMGRALDGLSVRPHAALIDGNRCPSGLEKPLDMTAVIGGDGVHTCIGAASILAKVHRDQLMIELDKIHPEFGFAKHKGYPTAQHMQSLREHGPTIYHRNSFRPVRKARELQGTKNELTSSNARTTGSRS
ncbi:MAG: ribonuclease HII [Gammaproteobacteria bacterium]